MIDIVSHGILNSSQYIYHYIPNFCIITYVCPHCGGFSAFWQGILQLAAHTTSAAAP